MTQQMYSIREAAQNLGVESHVLRYWEEELGIYVGRNPQGRRIYTAENLDTFRRVKSCKEQGLQLKAIRELLQKERAAESLTESYFANANQEEPVGERRIIMYRPKEAYSSDTNLAEQQERAAEASETERLEKARRLQELLKQFVKESVRESNAELLESVKEGLLKELDYQFRLQEEREEERERMRIEKENAHFRELDENLRTAMGRKSRKRRGMFTGR